MAQSSNKRNTNSSSGDSNSLPLVAGVGVFMVVCFCVGYFVMGKGIRGAGSNSGPAVEQVGSAGPTVVQNTAQKMPKGTITVIDNTAALEAKRKKAEEEAKKKADEEAKKKSDEDAKKKAEQEALLNAASPSPTASVAAPDPDDLPNPSPSPVESPTSPDPVPQPVESPSVKPVPSPKPSPKPSPSPAPTTPDDPEDHATNAPTVATGPLYRVRVGTFEAKNNAEARAAELKTSGYDTSLSTDVVDGKVIYRLQVAAYRSEKAAREFAKEVEAKGFKTTISHN